MFELRACFEVIHLLFFGFLLLFFSWIKTKYIFDDIYATIIKRF